MKLFLCCAVLLAAACAPVERHTFEDAYCEFDGHSLTVGTENFERSWKLCPQGLVTTGIKNLQSSRQWADVRNTRCDWAYYGLLGDDSEGELRSFSAVEDDDSGFAAAHLKVELEFYYPAVETWVKYQVRAYPGANGVYTGVSFRGEAAKHAEALPKENGICFDLVAGKEKYDYGANGLVPAHIASYAFGDGRVEYLIGGLDKSREYAVGLTWWSPSDKELVQNLTVTSVDGERAHTVASGRHVPSGAARQTPETLTFDLPADVLLDGSFRFVVERVKGRQAVVSEIWILEKSRGAYEVPGDVDRLAELRQGLPEGCVLAAYRNCGGQNRQPLDEVTGRVDFLPVDATALTRRYVGYYNDTQHRNTRETPLLKEEVVADPIAGRETNAWANALFVESGRDVLILVKESHKCVNQYGYDTGAFELTVEGIANTGTSLRPQEILADRYRQAWASWTVVGENTDEGRELALKRFERLRYPVNPATDIYIMANTWGSDRGVEASDEANVLKEMAVQKELGIDVQQIDDGYQKPKKGNRKAPTDGWYPHPDRYPEGFRNVRERAAAYGMKLGLWFAAMQVGLQEMKDNYDAAGFSYYKLDFANIRNHAQIEQLVDKIRAYELYTGHRSKVNWDVTENAPRFGYFWAKEYGCVFLENRKPRFPENVVYVPYLVLRDLWHLSKYCNLNKFQGSVQNKDRVDTVRSDACRYSHAYTVAIPLMSTPLFFQETQFYSPEARAEIRPVIAAYKSVREAIYRCLVFPIGEEPDNASWTGFQAWDDTSGDGYLTLFREIENGEASRLIRLRFASGRRVAFTDLLSGERFEAVADREGGVEFTLAAPGSFRLLKYEWK